MVRRPRRRKQTAAPRSKRMIILYIISILVVLSMAVGLALSMASRGSSAPLPVSMALTATIV